MAMMAASLPLLSYASNIFNIFKTPKGSYAAPQLFMEVLERVQREYVEELKPEDLYKYAAQGMLSSLDPHSTLFTAQEFEEVKIHTEGEFAGLGSEVMMEKGFVKIVSPYQDSPAAKAGLKPGDYIIAIEDQIVKGMKIDEAIAKLRGKAGTSVNITVFRESEQQTFKRTIKREKVEIKPVYYKLIDKDIGYVKIASFNQKTTQEVEAGIKNLGKQAKLKGLVLDLRSNPGGLLDQSIEVADLFLDKGIIVTIKGRNKRNTQVFEANKGQIAPKIPIAVLINNGTASAPEIVAGALQDHKRAIIVGEKSFGKGSVQAVIPLSDGSAIKLTTARYYTPLDRSIQEIGIQPDIIVQAANVVPLDKEKTFLTSEAELPGHLQNKSVDVKALGNIAIPSFENRIMEGLDKDFQLLRAVDLIKAMTIYNQLEINKQLTVLAVDEANK